LPDNVLAKYFITVNHEDFYADEQSNMFASHEYSVIRLLCVPATSAHLERFSQGGLIMRPHCAKMGDVMLELLMYLHCNRN